MFKSVMVAGLLSSVLALAAHAETKGNIPEGIYDGVSVKVRGTGAVNIVAMLDQADGKIVVCGIYFYDDKTNGVTKAVTDQVLKSVFFTLDGKNLGLTAQKFKGHENADAAKASQETRCMATKRTVESVKDARSFKAKLGAGSVVRY